MFGLMRSRARRGPGTSICSSRKPALPRRHRDSWFLVPTNSMGVLIASVRRIVLAPALESSVPVHTTPLWTVARRRAIPHFWALLTSKRKAQGDPFPDKLGPTASLLGLCAACNIKNAHTVTQDRDTDGPADMPGLTQPRTRRPLYIHAVINQEPCATPRCP